MRKKITLVILLLSAVLLVSAKQADQSVIRKVALSFFYEHARLSEGFNSNLIGIKEMVPTLLNGRIVYYTMTMSPNGWIVVSADDAVTPVLAYSYEDNLNAATLPPQFLSWMEKYQKQIDDAVNRNLPASANISAAWANYVNYDQNQPRSPLRLTGVAPLIIHTWDQGYPYNLL